MRAVILAGGHGRRLRPYTAVLPKPLMPLGDKPILEIVVQQLRRAGFDELTFAVGYLAGLIQAYFGDGERFGVRIAYSLESQPLGTAGPLTLVDGLDRDFLVMNGDILTDLDYRALMQAHRDADAVTTVAAFEKLVPISLGVLELDQQAQVAGYIEKPTLKYPVSTGIYCFRPRVLRYLERNEHCDLPDLIMRLVKAGERVKAYHHQGTWLDIGRVEDYETALNEYEKDRF